MSIKQLLNIPVAVDKACAWYILTPGISVVIMGIILFGWHLEVALLQYYLITASIILAVLLHELGHIVAAYLTHSKVNGLYITGIGAHIHYTYWTHRADLIVSASGPLTNILTAPIVWFCVPRGSEQDIFWLNTLFMTLIHLIFGLVNLIPLGGTDGKYILLTIKELRK